MQNRYDLSTDLFTKMTPMRPSKLRRFQGVGLRVFLALLIGSVGLMLGTAQASVIAYDEFRYAPGYILGGQDGGSGWATSYLSNVSAPVLMAKGSLPFGGLATAGNACETATSTSGLTDMERTLTTPLGADGTTAYLGFLIQPNELVSNGYAGFALGDMFVGILQSGFYGVQSADGISNRSSSTTVPLQNVTTFLVVRITFQPGADKIELFINPTPGQPLPDTPNAVKTDLDLGTITSVRMMADHAVELDELRLGTTFEDVAPLPVAPPSNLLFQSQATNQLALWAMSGPQVVGSLAIGPTPAPGWQLVGTGDFNQDGNQDLVFQDQASGQVVIWLMNGPFYMGGSVVPLNPGAGFQVAGIADMDWDGNPDLIFQNRATGQITVWLMDGTNFSVGVPLAKVADPGLTLVGVGDFDFDGMADLLFQDQSTGQIVVWFMNRLTYTGGAVLTTMPEAGWSVVGVGDYNGDGRPDLVFQNATTNQIALWYLQDFTYIGGDLVFPIPDAGYEIAPNR